MSHATNLIISGAYQKEWTFVVGTFVVEIILSRKTLSWGTKNNIKRFYFKVA